MDRRPSLVKRHSRNGKVKRRKGVKAEEERRGEEERIKKAEQRRRYGYTVNDATRKRCTMKPSSEEKVESGFVREETEMYEVAWVDRVDRIDGVVELVGLLA